MKKKAAVAAMIAALAIAQSTSAFAAGSTDTNTHYSNSSSSDNGDTDFNNTSSGSTSGSGSSSKSTSTTSSTGSTNPVQFGNGSSSSNTETVGNTDLSFVEDKTAQTAGLPSAVVTAIGNINNGKSLADAGTGLNLTGYSALVKTSAIRTNQAGTKIEKTGNVSFGIYVPNLTANLGDVQILFYNNMNGRWQLITPSKVDAASKTVNFTIPNSGTFTVIYKK